MYAWSLLKTNWRLIWGVLALASLAHVVYSVGFLVGQASIGVLGVVAMIVTTLMANGAVYRLALADRHPADPDFAIGHQGLQWRGAEGRLLLAGLLVAVFIGFMLILASLVGLAVLAGVLQAKAVPMRLGMTPQQLQAALGPTGFAIIVGAVTALGLLAIYLDVRLSLSQAATVDAKAVRVLQTWRATAGRQFWTVLGANILVQLPIKLISVRIAVALAGPDPHSAPPAAVLIAALVVGIPAGALILPVTAGVAAYFHRNLSAAPDASGLSTHRP